MKIGVTERGDGGIDLSWVQKLDKVDGAIIITKNLTDKCINSEAQVQVTFYGQIEEQWKAGIILEHYMEKPFMLVLLSKDVGKADMELYHNIMLE